MTRRQILAAVTVLTDETLSAVEGCAQKPDLVGLLKELAEGLDALLDAAETMEDAPEQDPTAAYDAARHLAVSATVFLCLSGWGRHEPAPDMH